MVELPDDFDPTHCHVCTMVGGLYACRAKLARWRRVFEHTRVVRWSALFTLTVGVVLDSRPGAAASLGLFWATIGVGVLAYQRGKVWTIRSEALKELINEETGKVTQPRASA